MVRMRYCDIFAALNAIPMFVFRNKLVIFHIFGLWYVNVVQIWCFFSLGCVWVAFCCIYRLSFWSRCFGKLLFLAMSLSMNVGPCHYGMARHRVADRGTASNMEGSCE